MTICRDLDENYNMSFLIAILILYLGGVYSRLLAPPKNVFFFSLEVIRIHSCYLE